MAILVGVHGWQDRRGEDTRRLRRIFLLSLSGHLCLLVVLSLAPPMQPIRLPPAIQVDLFEVMPAPAARRNPPPAVPALPSESPEAPPAPPPPLPKARGPPQRAPRVTPKARVEPEPIIQRRPRPRELSYEEALKRLEGEVGSELPPLPPVPAPRPAGRTDAPADTSRPSRIQGGVEPELAAWRLAVKRHVASAWITPPEFRKSGLVVEMRVNVAADGSLVGRPELLVSSGNPYYDDNALRALRRASPLPPPPSAGRRILIFSPEDN